MAGSSTEIEALLVNVIDPVDPTPRQLPAIFRDIVGRLNAQGLSYAVMGRIALARYERARYVSDIEIVAALDDHAPEHVATLVNNTRTRFAPYMDRHTRANAINLSLRACCDPVEKRLLTEAVTCTWFGVPTRLASPEHLLWFWCLSDAPDHHVDAAALIQDGTVDLHRVQSLLRKNDDVEESAQTRLRLAIGEAVLVSEFCFSRYMEERRARLKPDWVPIYRLRRKAEKDG